MSSSIAIIRVKDESYISGLRWLLQQLQRVAVWVSQRGDPSTPVLLLRLAHELHYFGGQSSVDALDVLRAQV